jgi:hypothetical protein
VDTALEFHQLCTEHLNDYAKKSFKLRILFGFKNVLNFKITTNYEQLMPNKYYHLEGYRKIIKKSINERGK